MSAYAIFQIMRHALTIQTEYKYTRGLNNGN
jgi:hypothetical protein